MVKANLLVAVLILNGVNDHNRVAELCSLHKVGSMWISVYQSIIDELKKRKR